MRRYFILIAFTLRRRHPPNQKVKYHQMQYSQYETYICTHGLAYFCLTIKIKKLFLSTETNLSASIWVSFLRALLHSISLSHFMYLFSSSQLNISISITDVPVQVVILSHSDCSNSLLTGVSSFSLVLFQSSKFPQIETIIMF